MASPNHVVLYRKYRPKRFSEVVGQRAIVRTFKNAVRLGKLAHAYLLSGPRGTGKTTIGRLIAKAANCKEPSEGEPCGSCRSCRAHRRGRSLDLVEIDAASNRGIDDVRSLRDRARLRAISGSGATKVYLIDEAHMLTEPASNALLKMVEEPPPQVIFVLATTEPWRLPATLRSRCQHFQFARVPSARIARLLAKVCRKEGLQAEGEALALIAAQAKGGVRDALVLLEQVRDASDDTFGIQETREALDLVEDARATEVAAAAMRRDLGGGLGLLRAVQEDGVELTRFQRQIVARLQELFSRSKGKKRDAALEALRAFADADCRRDPYSTASLEIALALCSMNGQAKGVEVALGRRATPDGDAPEEKAGKAARAVQRFVERFGYAAAIDVAQEVGLDFGVRWKRGKDDDQLIIDMTDLQIIAYASALRASREARSEQDT